MLSYHCCYVFFANQVHAIADILRQYIAHYGDWSHSSSRIDQTFQILNNKHLFFAASFCALTQLNYLNFVDILHRYLFVHLVYVRRPANFPLSSGSRHKEPNNNDIISHV